MKTTTMKYILASLAIVVAFALLAGVSPGLIAQELQADSQGTEASPQTAVPLVVETKTDDYVILDPKLYELIAQLEAKQDLTLEYIEEVRSELGLGEDTRPNLNTIAEQELFGLMSTASIYGARSKAALIWSWINDQGNTIQAKENLTAIPGIGQVTADALWPLVTVQDE